jgi:hypothetical protein
LCQWGTVNLLLRLHTARSSAFGAVLTPPPSLSPGGVAVLVRQFVLAADELHNRPLIEPMQEQQGETVVQPPSYFLVGAPFRLFDSTPNAYAVILTQQALR